METEDDLVFIQTSLLFSFKHELDSIRTTWFLQWKTTEKRCKTRTFITEWTKTYPFFYTNEQRRLRHQITCSSSNLFYMIQSNKCNVQYIGEAKRHLSNRFGEHRRTIEKAITQRHIDQSIAVLDHYRFCPFYWQYKSLSSRHNILATISAFWLFKNISVNAKSVQKVNLRAKKWTWEHKSETECKKVKLSAKRWNWKWLTAPTLSLAKQNGGQKFD